MAFPNNHEFEAELEGEFDSEFESEAEWEGESFLPGLASLFGLGESEGEFESEFEYEGEFEAEFEYEGEYFFNPKKLFKRVTTMLPNLKNLVRVATPLVRSAVMGSPGSMLGKIAGQLVSESEFEYEGEGEFEYEAEGEYESEYQVEAEYEGEFELEAPASQHEMLAELMAAVAAQAETETEAEAQVGGATTILLSRRDRRALRRLIPNLVRGAAVLTRILRRRRGTRQLVRAVPAVVSSTANTLARRAARGGPINPKVAGQVMARQTRNLLSSPRHTTRALMRNYRSARSATPTRTGPRYRRTAP